MDSNQIRYYLEVCKTLSFSKAANNLFVSQSNISKKIKQLEIELGLQLIIRNNKCVFLTKNGEEMYKFFLKFDKEFNEELELAHNRIHNAQKNINIGITEGYSIGKYVSHFHDEGTFVDYKIEFDRINTLVKSLYNSKYDIIIGPYKGLYQAIDQENLDGICVDEIKRVKRIIYFSKNHPLANKENLKITDFKDEPFYIGKSLVAKNNALEICKKEGFIGKFEPTKSGETIALKLLSGGYSLGDEWSRVVHDEDYKYIFIDHFQTIGMAYVSELLSEKKKKYIEEIKNIIDKY